MNADQFRHIIRAAAEVSGHSLFLVFGSQGVMGHFLEKGGDFEFWEKSRELDIAPLPFDQEASDLIDGCLGEMSGFDAFFRIHAHGCSDRTPVFPERWESRAEYVEIEGSCILLPSLEDLAMSKYVAGRPKDHVFLKKMWAERMLDRETMLSLIDELPMERDECRGIDKNALRKRIEADSAAGCRPSAARRPLFRPS